MLLDSFAFSLALPLVAIFYGPTDVGNKHTLSLGGMQLEASLRIARHTRLGIEVGGIGSGLLGVAIASPRATESNHTRTATYSLYMERPFNVDWHYRAGITRSQRFWHGNNTAPHDSLRVTQEIANTYVGPSVGVLYALDSAIKIGARYDLLLVDITSARYLNYAHTMMTWFSYTF